MKICFITPKNTAGGAERVMSILVNKLSHTNDVSFITIEGQEDFYSINDNVNRVKNELSLKKYNKLIKFLILIPTQLKRIQVIEKQIKAINPDIVISFLFNTNIITSFICKKNNIKFILSERNDPSSYSIFKRLLMKLFYLPADGFVCQSEKMKKYAMEKYKLKNVTVISNPITEDQYSSIKIKKEKKIISVGRLVEQKNHGLLINAFSKIVANYPEYNLYIYGEGPLKDSLNNQINKLKLNNKIFLNGVQKNVIKENRNAEIFVLSSNFEGYPNVLVEAMANGILSISTRFPSGVSESIIENGENGFLFDVNNEQELVNILKEILCDYSKFEKVADNGRKIVEKINVNTISELWLKYIKNVVNDKEE